MNDQPTLPFSITFAELPPMPAPSSWIWEGLAARGRISLFISQWKSGKTTLVSHLLARRRTGAALAGFAVSPGKSLVVSEEDPTFWAMRNQQLDFGAQSVYFVCQPFLHMPYDETLWTKLLDHAAAMQRQHDFDLLVIDPLAVFLPPYAEGNATLLVKALQPLRQLAELGMGIVLLHHPPKGETVLGQAARGSGALPGLVDIIIEMDYFRRSDLEDRRRRFHVLSRLEDGSRQFVLEYDREARDYRNLGNPLTLDFNDCWSIIADLLAGATQPLSRRELLDRWPNPEEAPKPASLWRFLDRAVETGLLTKSGRGTKSDPFRFAVVRKAAG